MKAIQTMRIERKMLKNIADSISEEIARKTYYKLLMLKYSKFVEFRISEIQKDF